MGYFSSCPPRPKIQKPKPARIPPQTPPPRGRVHHSASLCPEIISGGVRSAFPPHFPFWKALCFAQRRVARGETLVLHFFLKIGSSKCYNNTTKRNVREIRNRERIFGTKIRAVCPASALGGADEIPKFPPIA